MPYLRSGLSLLDVGCGPGTITVDLARRVAPGSVIGVDRERAVIAEATRLLDAGNVGNVQFKPADVYSLEFDDQSFDVVHAHQVLQHLTDPVAPWLRCVAWCARVGSWRSVIAITGALCGRRPIRCWIAGCSSTTTSVAATGLTLTRAGTS